VRRVLSQPAFRNLFIGQSLSAVGDSMVVIVLGLFITDRTGSTADVGLVLAAYTVPLVLFLLLGGVLADRLPRRTVMIASDLFRFVLHSVLAVLIVTDVVEVGHMIVIGALYGTAQAFFQPAYSGLVPQCVPEEDIQAAQGMTGFSRELSLVLGPAIGTVLFFASGPAGAFFFDALTFLVSVFFLSRVHPRVRGEAGERSTVIRELREGWAAVRSRVWVWASISAFSVVLLVSLAPYFVLGPAIAEEQYSDAAIFGVMQATWGVGSVIGTLVAARWRPQFPMRTGLLLTFFWPPSLVALALGAPVPALLVATAAGGAGFSIFVVWWETALAERIPPHLLSRVAAYDWMGSLALLPVGYVLAGILGETVGVSETALVGAGISAVALLLAFAPQETRTLRRLEPTA
jgi:MFS family permease